MSEPAENPNLVDLYLDSLLPSEERDRFERDVLAASPELTAEVRQQRAVDESIRRMFPVPKTPPELGWTRIHAIASAGPGRLFATRPLVRALSIAAVLALGVFGGWRIWRFASPPAAKNPYAVMAWRPMASVYDDIVAGGFQPDWACKNDAEFASITRRRLGIPLLLAQTDLVTAVGWTYANTLGSQTMCLLATVKAEPSAEATKVIVFADRARNDRAPDPTISTSRHLFRRQMDTVVLYEVSPLDAPTVLNRLYQPAP